MRALVVEDHNDTRKLLRRLLEKGGFEVAEAADGREALTLVRAERFDVVLTDWMMPNVDGLELIRTLRGEPNGCPPILMLTALESDEAFEAAFSAGADDYLPKPVNGKQLLARVEMLVTRYQQAGAVAAGREDPPPLPATPLAAPSSEPAPSAAQLPRRAGSGRTTAPQGTRIGVEATLPPFVAVAVVGAAGGASALRGLFEACDRNTLDSAAFAVVLHEQDWVRDGLARRFAEVLRVPAHCVTEPMAAAAGCLYFAYGERHLAIEGRARPWLRTLDEPPHNHLRPSADWLFGSMASVFGRYGIAVVLSGMGVDGARGAELCARAGGRVLVQDPGGADVSAMPATAISLVPSATVAPVAALGGALSEAVVSLRHELDAARALALG